MRNRISRFLIFSIFILFSTLTLFAADDSVSLITPRPRAVERSSEWKPHMGFVVGAAIPEGGGNSSTEFGFDVGYQPYIPFGLGAELLYSKIDIGSDQQDRTTLWVKGTYNFGGTTPVLRESYAGVAIGGVFKTEEVAAAIAPIIGFDIPIGSRAAGYFSLGANARYAIVSNNDIDTFSLNGVVKYWY